ncbi:MAG: helix-turn-helix domain-containing protein [Burkholderiaceae bacterium]
MADKQVNAPAASENLAPRAVAQWLGVPEGTLASWRSTGRVELPFLKLGGLIRYRRADVEAFLAASQRGGR